MKCDRPCQKSSCLHRNHENGLFATTVVVMFLPSLVDLISFLVNFTISICRGEVVCKNRGIWNWPVIWHWPLLQVGTGEQSSCFFLRIQIKGKRYDAIFITH